MAAANALPHPDVVEGWILSGSFHEWLGLKVIDLTADSIELSATWRPEWMNDSGNGVTHGGIIASLLDLAADWALVGMVGTAVPTVDFSVQYLRAAKKGDLRVVGRVLKPGRSVSFAEAELFGPDGQLVAVGRGTYASSAAEAIIANRTAEA